MAESKPKKRIVLTLGGKGGTGKTLFNRTLYYYLMSQGVKCLGYDADVENPEFAGYHNAEQKQIKLLNFLDVSSAKNLFTEIDSEKPDVVLIDLPGASGKDTREQIQRFDAFRLSDDLGYRLTVATVLNIDYNTINSLQSMQDFCKDAVDYVAVKSQLWRQSSGNDFTRWVASQTRQQFLEFKGIEIELPVLELSVFDLIHEQNLSFFNIGKLPFGDKILAEAYLSRVLPELNKAAAYLGLPAEVPKTKSTKANGKAADPTKMPELLSNPS
ncbi:MAG TPA: hypothetical protein V6D19_23070 [Stenomitos sp.]